MEVPREDTQRYGVIAGEEVEGALNHGRLHKVSRLVEKPAPEDAPSDLAIIGRYVLTPKIFDKLEQTQSGAGGEIQLTDAIEALMQEQAVYGYEFEGTRYDCGHDDGLAEGVGRAGARSGRSSPRSSGLHPGPGAVSGSARPEGRADLKRQWVRFGFGPSGEWFGLQKKPGFATCGSWIRPA